MCKQQTAIHTVFSAAFLYMQDRLYYKGEGGEEREGKRGSGGRDDNWLCSCVHAYNAFSLFYNMRGTVAYQLHVPADQQRQ